MLWKHLFSRPRPAELNDELRFHFETLVQENIKGGLSEHEARRQARVAFGNMDRAIEDTAGQYPGWWLDVLSQDLRYGLRGLRRNPAFATAAVLTLALGIGASTAVFSVVDHILFRSLPYAHDERLVSVGLTAPIMPQEFMLGSSYFVWKETQTAFDKFTSWSGVNQCDLSEANPEHLVCAFVESDFIPTLGIGLIRGRNFLAEEDVPNGPKVALISYGLWQTRFGKSEDVLGKTVSLNGEQTRIIGVLPPTFELPDLEHSDVLVPQRVDVAAQRRPGATHIMYAIGRLKAGISATAAMASLQPQFEQALSQTPPRFRKEVHLRVRSLRDFQVHDARLMAWVLFIAVLGVLLIAGANVSGLLLARASDREGEFAIRKSLGASRARLLGQLLAEALLLSLLGIIAGCAVGEILLRVFVNLAPPAIPYIGQARLDGRVLGFAVAIALLSAILFGSAPFWSSEVLKKRSFRTAAASPRAYARQALLIAQVSLTLVLLTAAGLLLRTARNLQNQSLGIRTGQLLTATVHLGRYRYADAIKRMQFVNQLEDKLKQIPGIESVAVTDSLPPGGLEHDRIIGVIAVEGRPRPEGGTGGNVAWRAVTPAYFSTFGIRMVRGRAFTEEDRESNDRVLIISDAMAARLFPGEDPVGQHVDLHESDHDNPWYTIVGVAANVKNGGLAAESEPEYYKLWRNRPEDWNSGFAGTAGFPVVFTVDSPADPKALQSVIRSDAASVDPTLPVEFMTLREHVSSLADRPRFEAALLSLFAGLAILLAAIGLYGVIAFIVSRRTSEIAVRIALGAQKQDIVRLIGSDGMRMLGVGVGLGIAGAFAAGHVLSALLFDVKVSDPLTLSIAVIVLLGAGALAMWIPVRRAIHVDPMQALRYE